MTKVKNVNGSSRFPAPRGYNSWLEYRESRLDNTYPFVVPQDAVIPIWLVHMCRKQTAQTSRGTLLHYAPHATIEQTSLMSIGHWYLSQATSKNSRAAHPVRIERPKWSGQVTAVRLTKNIKYVQNNYN